MECASFRGRGLWARFIALREREDGRRGRPAAHRLLDKRRRELQQPRPSLGHLRAGDDAGLDIEHGVGAVTRHATLVEHGPGEGLPEHRLDRIPVERSDCHLRLTTTRNAAAEPAGRSECTGRTGPGCVRRLARARGCRAVPAEWPGRGGRPEVPGLGPEASSVDRNATGHPPSPRLARFRRRAAADGRGPPALPGCGPGVQVDRRRGPEQGRTTTLGDAPGDRVASSWTPGGRPGLREVVLDPGRWDP